MKENLLLAFLVAGCFLLDACGGGSKTTEDAAEDGREVRDGEMDMDIIPDTEITEPSRDEAGGDDRDISGEGARDTAEIADMGEEEASSAWEGIECGEATCIDPRICCWDITGETPVAQCTTEENCAAPDSFPVRCDGPEDCGLAETCCCSNCHWGDSLPEAYCAETETCDRLCHTEADCEEGELCCGFIGIGNVLLFHCYAGTICPP